jgi:hypothetical protein
VTRIGGRVARHDVPVRALMRPATEKRQGTKSREIEQRRCSEHYGDLMLALASMVGATLARRDLGMCTQGSPGRCNKEQGGFSERINERSVLCSRRLDRERSPPASNQRLPCPCPRCGARMIVIKVFACGCVILSHVRLQIPLGYCGDSGENFYLVEIGPRRGGRFGYCLCVDRTRSIGGRWSESGVDRQAKASRGSRSGMSL